MKSIWFSWIFKARNNINTLNPIINLFSYVTTIFNKYNSSPIKYVIMIKISTTIQIINNYKMKINLKIKVDLIIILYKLNKLEKQSNLIF
jgi:hypothetical protein